MTQTKTKPPSVTIDLAGRLRAAGIIANKTLGQHFLVNAGIYEKLITSAELKSGERVLEIGPGLGTLTDYLRLTGARISAVEKDPALVAYLTKRYQTMPEVEIIA